MEGVGEDCDGTVLTMVVAGENRARPAVIRLTFNGGSINGRDGPAALDVPPFVAAKEMCVLFGKENCSGIETSERGGVL